VEFSNFSGERGRLDSLERLFEIPEREWRELTELDPTDDSEGPTPQRYWKVRPFQTTDVQQIEELMLPDEVVGETFPVAWHGLSAGAAAQVVGCARCDAMFRFLQPCVRGLGDGDEHCDPALDCGHVWSDNFEGEPPLVVQALAFLTPAEAQVLLEKRARFRRRVSGDFGSADVSGPVESEDGRIARLLRRTLGDRLPASTESVVPVEREGREESWDS
jgi:hypothetical protein